MTNKDIIKLERNRVSFYLFCGDQFMHQICFILGNRKKSYIILFLLRRSQDLRCNWCLVCSLKFLFGLVILKKKLVYHKVAGSCTSWLVAPQKLIVAQSIFRNFFTFYKISLDFCFYRMFQKINVIHCRLICLGVLSFGCKPS